MYLGSSLGSWMKEMKEKGVCCGVKEKAVSFVS